MAWEGAGGAVIRCPPAPHARDHTSTLHERGIAMRERILHGLIGAAALLSLGHHLDHVIRGNQVGWPLIPDVTPFTYSLGIYPLLLLGLFLYRAGRAGPGCWMALSGGGALFVGALHFGPAAVETPADIIGAYAAPIVGRFAFGWLVALVALLVGTFLYEATLWSRRRRGG